MCNDAWNEEKKMSHLEAQSLGHTLQIRFSPENVT